MSEAKQPTQEEPKPRRSWGRRLLRWGRNLLIGLFALPVVLLIGLQIQFIRGPIVQIGLGFADVALDGKIKLGALKGNLFTSLILEDFEWRTREGKLMVSLKRLEARYDLMRFLKQGELFVKDVKIQKVAGSMGSEWYGISPGKGGAAVIKRIDAGQREAARKKYALVTPMIDLLSHVKPLLPYFCKSDEACGKSAFCERFKQRPPASFRDWKGTCKSKPPPKKSEGGIKITIPAIAIDDTDFAWRLGPKSAVGVKGFSTKISFSMAKAIKAQIRDTRFTSLLPPLKCRDMRLDFSMLGNEVAIKDLALLFGKRSELHLDAGLGLKKVLGVRAKLKKVFVTAEDMKPIVPAWPIRPNIEVSADVDGALNGLTARLQAKIGKMTLGVQARTDVLGQKYDAKIALRGLDLSEFLGKPSMKSQVGIDLQAKGTGFSAATVGQAKVVVHKGFFQKYAFEGVDLDVGLDKQKVDIQKLDARTSYAGLAATGTAHLQTGAIDIQVQGRVPNLRPVGALFNQKLRGSAFLKSRVKGIKWLPGKGTVSLVQVRRFRHPSAYIRSADVHLRLGSLKPTITAGVSLDAKGIYAGGQRVRRFGVSLGYQMKGPLQMAQLRRLQFNIGSGMYKLDSRRVRGKRRKYSPALSFDTKKMLARIRHFYLHRYREKIRVDGWIDVKKWRQDLKVEIRRLDLAALRRALRIMPKSKLAGKLRMRLGFRGSFARPRVALRLRLDGGRFQKYRRLKARVKLLYAEEEVARKQRLKLRTDLFVGGVKLVRLRASLPVGIAIRGRLRPPLLLKNPAVRLDIKKPISLDLQVPGVQLGRLKKLIGQPIGGWARVHLKLSRNVRNPKLKLTLRLKNAAWERSRLMTVKIKPSKTKKARKIGKMVVRRQKPQTMRVVDMKIRDVDASIKMHYQRGKLYFKPNENWVKYKNLPLLTLAGQLPLSVKAYQKRRKLAFRYGLVPGRPLDFRLGLPDNSLSTFWRFVPKSLLKTVGHFRGKFGGEIKLVGLPLQPKIGIRLKLSKGSFCPLENGKFTCWKRAPAYLQKRRKRKIQPKPLRIHGVSFGLNINYAPPKRSTIRRTRSTIRFGAPGNLQISSLLTVGTKKILEISETLEGKPTGIALAFAIHPNSLSPFYRLFVKQPSRFELKIPKVNISSSGNTFCSQKKRGERRSSEPSIVDFVRLPILRRLKGNISLRVFFREKLSAPFAKVSFKLRKGAYLYSCDDEGRPRWLDKLSSTVSLSVSPLNKGLALASIRLSALNQTLLTALANIQLQAGLHAVRNRKTRAIQYKARVKFGRQMFARMLLCRFRLQKLGKLGGIFTKLAGTVQGLIKLKGDPACPVFLSGNSKGRIPSSAPKDPCAQIENTSHILLQDLILGDRTKRKRSLSTKPKRASKLHIDRFRIDLKSIAKGRTRIDIDAKGYACKNSKYRPRGAKGRAILRGMLKRSRKLCPGGKVSIIKTTYWFLTPRKINLLQTKFLGYLPLGLMKVSAKEAAKRCPHWQGPTPSKKLFVDVTSTGIPLAFLGSFVPGLKLRAFFGPNFTATGDGKNPPVIKNAKVSLDIDRMSYPSYGVDIVSDRSNRLKRRKSNIFIFIKPTTYKLVGQLQGRFGTPLLLRGNVTHKNFIPQSYLINIKATDFRPMNTLKYKLSMKSNISIWKNKPGRTRKYLGKGQKFNKDTIWVRGNLTIPQMLFTLASSGTSATTYKEDDDIIVYGEPSEKKLRKTVVAERPPATGVTSQLNVFLRLSIPRNFIVRNKELQMEAKTDRDVGLQIRLLRGALQLAGGVEIVRGELAQFGKRFTVQGNSRVSFSGQSIPLSQIGSRIDPRLGVTAVYMLNVPKNSSLAKKGHKKVKIFLIVGGSARNIQISFRVQDAFTDQVIPLDKVNVLALILTGSTTDDLSSGQQKNLANQAFGMVGRAIASEIRNQISGVVPLDVLNIESGSRLEDIKIEVGWYLSPQWYLQFTGKPAPLDEENYWEALLDWSIDRSLSLELRVGMLKRNDVGVFRGSGHIFYRTKF